MRHKGKSKNLNTYVNDVCFEHTLEEAYVHTYRNLKIVVSDSAMHELMKESKTLFDVVEMLERGRYAPRKRKRSVVEKWLDKGNKTFNAVVAKDYNEKMFERAKNNLNFTKKKLK